MVPQTSRHAPGRLAQLLIRSSLIALILLLSPGSRGGTSFAQPPSSGGARASAESLTQSLVALNAQYQLGHSAKRSELQDSLLTLATTRQAHLSALIENNPGEVLRVAVPGGVRASLPAEVRDAVEEEVVVEGELEVMTEDRMDGSRILHFLHAYGARLSLHFAADSPMDLQTGDRVRVWGVRVKQALALESGSTSVQALAPALLNTFGAQKTLVILVNFQDNQTQPYTVASAQGVLTTASTFDSEASYGQAWLTGVVDPSHAADVRGWYTIALSTTVCDHHTLASQAMSAASAAGVNLSTYTRYVFAFPSNACTWWGMGTVGGNPSTAWVNGSFELKVVGHEMGHNFGLYHSHAMECGASTVGSNCTTDEMGDMLDIMGNPSAGHFNAFQKERLGWLGYGSSPPITTVQANGIYWLDRYEAVGANPKALKILKSTDPATGSRTWYYVEYRQAVGFDNFLSGSSNVLNGVVIHTGSESSGNSSGLLDLTPETSSWSDPALLVGDSFYDPDAGVTIATQSTNSTRAGVSVTFGGQACVSANPTVALSPSQSQWVHTGTPVTYTVSVTNNDNADCAPSSFTLQATLPSGWAATFGAPTLSLIPGASGSTSLTITSPASATDGFYNVTATVTKGVTSVAASGSTSTSTASALGTYVIVSSLSVAVSTDKSSYGRNRMVSITAVVGGDGSPASNASVTFTIKTPDGATVTGTATTGTNGSAVFNYHMSRRDPKGTYHITANANLNNAIFGSGLGSFTVQ